MTQEQFEVWARENRSRMNGEGEPMRCIGCGQPVSFLYPGTGILDTEGEEPQAWHRDCAPKEAFAGDKG